MSAKRVHNPLILGIDGGNSKVDIALADAHGILLSARRGPTISHQAVGIDVGMTRLDALVRELVAGLDAPAAKPRLAVATVAGADYPEDVRLLNRAISKLEIADEIVVLNDTFGALRAGASAGWGVGLVCGQGINAGAIAPNGKRARFPGVGDIAGDWGGGGGIAQDALRSAIRGRDGRGPRTALERSVPAFFDEKSTDSLTRALYFGRIPESRIQTMAPLVFTEAAAGDGVARSIIDRLADELAAMANSLMRKLRLTALPVEIVLAGGVFRTTDSEFYARLESNIRSTAPEAILIKLDAPPVAGAVLLGLDEFARRGLAGEPHAHLAEKLRSSLRAWDATQRRS